MESQMLKQNLLFLKDNFKEFYTNLVDPSFSVTALKITDTGQAGNYLASLGNVKCHLHSVFNVGREMEKLFVPLGDDGNQVIVIFGLGYGHCLDYIRKHKIKYKRLVVFEPCSNILFEVLKKRSVKELLSFKDLYLHLLNVPNDMARFLLIEALESKTVKILRHVSYMTLFNEVFENVIRSFRNEKITMQTSINTIRANSLNWNIQQLKSIQHLYPSITMMRDKFINVPGIVASAGPSLEKHLPLLREIGDRAVVVAPGSTNRILNNKNINAHIAISIDSSEIQKQFFINYKLKNILIASYRLHPETLKMFPNEIFNVALSTEYLASYYTDWIGWQQFTIDDHSSVAVAAVEVLHMMGCNPIILIGQDLAYTEDRKYADKKPGSLTEKQINRRIPDVDIYGNAVFTDHGYKSMQHDMETLNIRFRDTMKTYNATEGGLNIHGIDNVKFTDVYDKYIKNRPDDVTGRIKEIINRIGIDGIGNGNTGETGNSSIDANKGITDFFGHLLKVCGDIDKLIADKQNGFTQFAKLVERGVSNNRLNGEMRNIQEYNKRLNEIPFYNKVVFPNVEAPLTYVRAGGKHIADSGEDWEGAMVYEQTLDEYASDFVNTFKAIVLQEMVSGMQTHTEAAV